MGGHSIHRYLLFSGVPATRLDPPQKLVSRPRPPQALEALKTIPSLKYLQLDLSGNQLGKEDAAQGLSWGREGTPYPSPQMGMSRRAAWNDFPSTTPLPLNSIRCSGYGGGFEESSGVLWPSCQQFSVARQNDSVSSRAREAVPQEST